MNCALRALAERRRFGMKPGLDAIRCLCATLDNPQRRFPAIHVAGTNGKGAVVALLAAALQAAGYSVGRYTSPHLVRLNERFVLKGEPTSDETLDALSRRVTTAIAAASLPDVTYFEALTAVAFLLYAEAPVDVAVLECGLGGRLDATNICSSVVSVITRIGLDHCDWLGDTVEKIAAEKAGIIRAGVPVVLGRNEPSVRRVIAARAAEVGAPFVYAPEVVALAEIPADFALGGSFNRENAQTALAALQALPKAFAVPTSAWTHACASVRWPGRFQRCGNYLIDGAHNPPAAEALAAALRAEDPQGKVRWNLIAGFCDDKDVDTVLKTLAPFVDRGYAVRTSNPRSLSADETARRMRFAGMAAVAAEDLAAALSATKGAPTLICGSLFLAGDALAALGGLPANASVSSPDPSELLVSQKPLGVSA